MRAKPSIFAYHKDESAGATEFRRLARNVRYRGNPSEVRSILVTSATKHEGKSLIAANLAIAVAKREKDKQVLLIDCDLRRPMVHTLFGMEKEPGFTALLAESRNDAEKERHGDAENSRVPASPRPCVSDVVRDTELTNLKVILSGQSVDSPSQLLASAEDALNTCKSQFDILICDAPPVVPVDDIGILGPHVDGVLLVVLAGKTDRVVVKRAIDILSDVRAKVLGVVLNNLHGVLPYYYNYEYYRYKYEREEVPNDAAKGRGSEGAKRRGDAETRRHGDARVSSL